jgi:hypothetical protein
MKSTRLGMLSVKIVHKKVKIVHGKTFVSGA